MENLNAQIAELIDAVRRSNIRQIKRLLAANVSPIQCSRDGQTALMIAAQVGDARIIQLLCLAAANRSSPAQIFFHTDSVTSDLPVAPPLVPEPFPSLIPAPGLNNPQGSRAALICDAHMPIPVAPELSSPSFSPKEEPAKSEPGEIESKPRASVKPPAPKLSTKSLELAIRRNDLQAVNALLKAGVSFRPARWYDSPPLVIAAAEGYEEIVQTLIDAGANVHIGYDQLPLHAAAANGHLAVVQRLLNSGAYAHSQAEGGRTALMEAAENGHFLVAELLIAKGADVNATCRGETALMMAATKRHRAVYDLLYPHVPSSEQVPFPQSMSNALQLSL